MIKDADGNFLKSQSYILTEDIISKDDIPINDNSAMDGFAVILSDLTPIFTARIIVIKNIGGHSFP